jgi:signal transduction histidine kinase
MRERLIIAFVGLTVVVVALYGIPRAYFVADLVRTEEQHRVDDTARLVAVALDQRTAPITTAALDALNTEHEWIVVKRGSTTVGTTGSEAGPGTDDLESSRPLRGGGTITVGRSADAVSTEVSNAILPLVLLGLGLIVFAGFAGFVLARRMARPFQDLAEAARGLGAGELHPELPTYRVPEAQAIASALKSSGDQIDALLGHERELAVHASHELRTPITALRLELEDLALWKETAPEVAAQLQQATGELDRLATAVGDLMDLSRRHRQDAEMNLDLELLVDDAITHLGDEEGRVFHVRGGPLPTRLDPLPVARLVRELIDLALRDGADHVTVTARNEETHHEVRVHSEGLKMITSPKVPLVTQELAVSLGGQIARDHATLVLRLPIHKVD